MNRKAELIVLFFADVLAFHAAYFLFYLARFEWGWVDSPSQKPATLLLPMLVISGYWSLVFLFSGMYRARFAASRIDELISIIKVCTVGILILFFALFIEQGDAYSGRLPIFTYWGAMVGCVIVERLLIRTLQKILVLRGYGLHNTLIVGWSELLDAFYEEIKRYPAAGFKVVGVLRLLRAPDALPHTSQPHTEGAIIAAEHIGALPQLIEDLKVQDVLITLGSEGHDILAEVLRLCDGKSVSLKLVPDFYSVIGGMARTEHIYGLPLIEVSPEPMAAWEESTKRLLDLTVALLGLILGLPFMAGIGILIRLSSLGPAIYRQQRVGQYGRVFTMYKFRTMRQDAEAKTGPVWATADDPRYTPIGRWLRKTRLDELPQLWNVLVGNMSLVGPRPERPYFVEKLAKEIPLYGRRHRVKPGITGLAQVKWKYDASLDDVRQKVKYDLFYIENMSLKQDISILFQTIRTAILGKGQ